MWNALNPVYLIVRIKWAVWCNNSLWCHHAHIQTTETLVWICMWRGSLWVQERLTCVAYDQQGLVFEVVMEVVSNWTICECTHNNNNNNNNKINWRSWSYAILVWLGNSQIPNAFSGIHSDSMDGRLWETQALLPCKTMNIIRERA